MPKLDYETVQFFARYFGQQLELARESLTELQRQDDAKGRRSDDLPILAQTARVGAFEAVIEFFDETLHGLERESRPQAVVFACPPGQQAPAGQEAKPDFGDFRAGDWVKRRRGAHVFGRILQLEIEPAHVRESVTSYAGVDVPARAMATVRWGLTRHTESRVQLSALRKVNAPQ